MPDMLEQFAEETIEELLKRLPTEKRLKGVPVEERLIIGPQTTCHLGSRHDPDVARKALEESKKKIVQNGQP